MGASRIISANSYLRDTLVANCFQMEQIIGNSECLSSVFNQHSRYFVYSRLLLIFWAELFPDLRLSNKQRDPILEQL